MKIKTATNKELEQLGKDVDSNRKIFVSTICWEETGMDQTSQSCQQQFGRRTGSLPLSRVFCFVVAICARPGTEITEIALSLIGAIFGERSDRPRICGFSRPSQAS